MTTISAQPPAATRFFGNPELVGLVAKHCLHPYAGRGIIPTLANLRLVDRTCNLMAKPVCFMEMRIVASLADTRTQGCLNPRRDLVKRVFFYHYVDGLGEQLKDIISEMSQLESFVCVRLCTLHKYTSPYRSQLTITPTQILR